MKNIYIRPLFCRFLKFLKSLADHHLLPLGCGFQVAPTLWVWRVQTKRKSRLSHQEICWLVLCPQVFFYLVRSDGAPMWLCGQSMRPPGSLLTKYIMEEASWPRGLQLHPVIHSRARDGMTAYFSSFACAFLPLTKWSMNFFSPQNIFHLLRIKQST